MGTELILRFVGVDMVSDVTSRIGYSMDRVQSRVQQFGLVSGQALMTAGAAASAMGASMLMAFGALAIGVDKAVSSAVDFQSQLVLLHTHADFATGSVQQVSAQLQSLGNDLIKMAPQVGQGPDELAKAFFKVQSAVTSLPPQFQNVSAEEEILRQSAELAAIGHADLEKTTDTVVATLAVYGKQVNSTTKQNYTANDVVGILNTTVGEGKMRFDDLATALGTGILPVAQQSGISLQSLGAAIATMTDAGIPASRAATYLRSAILQITSPSDQAAGALQAVGIDAGETASRMSGFSDVLAKAGVNQTEVAEKLRSTGSLGDTMTWLQGKLQAAGLSSTQAADLMNKAFGGIRSGTGVVTLANNLQGLQQKEKDATTGALDFQKTWDYYRQNDPDFLLQQLQATFKDLAVVLGGILIPAMRGLVDALIPIIQQLIPFVDQHRQFLAIAIPVAMAVTGVGGAILLFGGAIATIAGSFFTFIGMIGGMNFAMLAAPAILGGVGLAVGALAAAVGFTLLPNLGALKDAFEQGIAHSADTSKVHLDSMKESISGENGLDKALQNLFVNIGKAWKDSGLSGIDWDFLTQTLKEWADLAQSGDFDTLATKIANMLTYLAKSFGSFINAIPWDQIGYQMGQRAYDVCAAFIKGVGDYMKAHWVDILFAFLSVGEGIINGLTELVIGALYAIGTAIMTQFIPYLFSTVLPAIGGAIGGAVSQILLVVAQVFYAGFQVLASLVMIGVQVLLIPFQWLYDQLVGHSIIPDLILEIVRWFTQLPLMVGQALMNLITGVTGILGGLGNFVSGIFGGMHQNASTQSNGMNTDVQGAFAQMQAQANAQMQQLQSGAVGQMGSTQQGVTGYSGSMANTVSSDSAWMQMQAVAQAAGMNLGVTGQSGQMANNAYNAAYGMQYGVSSQAGQMQGNVSYQAAYMQQQASLQSAIMQNTATQQSILMHLQVIDQIGNMVSTSIGHFSNLLGNTGYFFTSIYQTATSWTNSTVSFVGSLFGQLGTMVHGALSGAAHQAQSDLQSIVDGVINHGFIDKINNSFLGTKLGVHLDYVPPLPPPPFAAGGNVPTRGVGPGFKTNGPTFLRAEVGEGRRSYPEYVIATDPAHRGRSKALVSQVARDLGIPTLGAGVPTFGAGGTLCSDCGLPAHGMGGGGKGAGLTVSPPTSGHGGQCLAFLSQFFPQLRGIPAAKDAAGLVNSSTPKAGEVGIATFPPYGHAWLMISNDMVLDSNWGEDEMIREHPLSDISSIAGYIDFGAQLGTLAGGIGSALNPGQIVNDIINQVLGSFHAPEWLKDVPGHLLKDIIGPKTIDWITKTFAAQLRALSGAFAGILGGVSGNVSPDQLHQWMQQIGFMPAGGYAWADRIVKAESGFNSNAIGPAVNNDGGSRGLWQIQPAAWPMFDKNSLLDGFYNTQAAKYVYDHSGPTAWSTNAAGGILAALMGGGQLPSFGFARGGPMPPGIGIFNNEGRRNEYVYSGKQQEAIVSELQALRAELANGGQDVHVNFDGVVAPSQVAHEVAKQTAQEMAWQRGNVRR